MSDATLLQVCLLLGVFVPLLSFAFLSFFGTKLPSQGARQREPGEHDDDGHHPGGPSSNRAQRPTHPLRSHTHLLGSHARRALAASHMAPTPRSVHHQNALRKRCLPRPIPNRAWRLARHSERCVHPQRSRAESIRRGKRRWQQDKGSGPDQRSSHGPLAPDRETAAERQLRPGPL